MLDSIHQNENGVQGALQQLYIRIAKLLLPQPFMKIEDLLSVGFQQTTRQWPPMYRHELGFKEWSKWDWACAICFPVLGHGESSNARMTWPSL
jgi:hypothetical protein